MTMLELIILKIIRLKQCIENSSAFQTINKYKNTGKHCKIQSPHLALSNICSMADAFIFDLC